MNMADRCRICSKQTICDLEPLPDCALYTPVKRFEFSTEV